MDQPREHFPNLVTMFLTRARGKGDAPFLGSKSSGAGQSISWAEAARQVAGLPGAITTPPHGTAAAQVQVWVHDCATDPPLACGVNFIEKATDKRHVRYWLDPGEVGSLTLYIDLPPGVSESDVRIESSASLWLCGEECLAGVAF